MNNKLLKYYIRQNENYSKIIEYTLKLISKNSCVDLVSVESNTNAEIIFDHLHPESQIIAQTFYQNPTSLFYREQLSNLLQIQDERNQKDRIATIFALVNCIQEYENDDLDEFGRFKYSNSLQFRHHIIQENIVQKEIDYFLERLDKKRKDFKSEIFISHDIDSIHGSLLQDTFWAIKKLRGIDLIKIITINLLKEPHWKNFDRIMKINSEYDFYSTFFFLVNQGLGDDNVKNSDYKIQKINSSISRIQDSNFECGLHKSSSNQSINDETKKLPFNSISNRYHFLKFNIEKDWKELSDSSIQLDASLGFAEHFGFRNSYGRAFQPFNIAENKPFDFIELPLHLMDTTFEKYLKIPTNEIGTSVINFLEKHKMNCELSLLWHNNYFSDYKYGGYLAEYKKILAYLFENEFKHVSQLELINRNKIE